MNFLKSKKNLIGIILFIITIIVITFFDKVLAIGIILIVFLTLITFLVLFKIGIKSKTLILLLLITFLIHFGAVLFIHYANFQPFSGGSGDYIVYQKVAEEIALRVHQGNFSLEELDMSHYYPVIIGYIYALTIPEMLIGQLFGVWLAVLSVLFVYLIILEIDGSKKQAFLIGLIVCIYPSYLFFGSLLLKDTLVVPLVLAGLLLTLKLIKDFSWRNFVIFYIVLGAVIDFRFYVGYAVLFTFIPCWLLLCKLNLKKKFIYGIIIIILLGFLPQFLGYGYYGFKPIKQFLNPETITFYREIVYAPLSPSVVEAPETQAPETPASETLLNKLVLKVFPNIEKTSSRLGIASSVKVKTESDNFLNFLINYSKSFIYVLLGPLPWQIQSYKQLFVLLETIPWYFLLFFVIKGAFIALKQKRITLPLLVFSIISLGVLSLFIANFGIITRIRMPSFIALFCLIPLAFIRESKERIKRGNNKTKVCYVTNIDKSVKFILFNQLKFLKNEGYEVYTACSPGKWIRDIENEKIKVKTIRFKRKISPISDLIAFVKLFFYFKKEKFDIVHTHTPKPGLLGQSAAKMAGVPIIVNTVHGFYFQKENSWLKRKFFILIEKIAAKCSDLIFFINREDMETAIKERICPYSLRRYFGGGVDMERFNPERFSEEFILAKKKQLDIDPNKKIIGIVARLVEEKGYLELFEAFKEVLEKFPETLLLIIGFEEPEKRDAIDYKIIRKYNIQKNVIFLVERTDVEELYPLMDVFALPTHREGLGIVLLEASAMQIPVVATNTGGCPEAVDDEKTGILIPLKDVKKLTEAIFYLFDNPEKAKKMGQNGREKILREFDEKLVFDILKTEYQRLINEKLKNISKTFK